MKIALINDTFMLGRGIDHVVFDLACEMGKENEVTVITGHADMPEQGFRIFLVPGAHKLLQGNWKDFLGIFQLFKYRKYADQYDIINLHRMVLALAFIGKKNVVVTYHGSPPPVEEGLFRRVMRNIANRISRSALRFIPMTIAISNYAKKELADSSVPEKKIEVIYNGLSKDFTPATGTQAEKFMLFVGRQEHYKGANELIHIAAELDFPLHLAGTGPEAENLKRLAQRIRAPVTIHGLVSEEEKVALYQRCTFFISGSKWENFGLIFLEASSCGKPCVGYNLCSIPEIVQHGHTGLLADDTSYLQLKHCARVMIENSDLRKRLGRQAISWSENFNWRKTSAKYLQLFNSVLSNNHGKSG